MSTRANIKLNFGDNQLWLYAHHDGYTEHRGVELAKALQSAWKTNSVGKSSTDNEWFYNDVVCRLAGILIENHHHDSRKKTYGDQYEITIREHGDIEYLYEIEANPNGLTGLYFQVSEVSRDEHFDNVHDEIYGVWVDDEEHTPEDVIGSMELGSTKLKRGLKV